MSYADFAYIYDTLIDEDYDVWTNYIMQIFKQNNASPKLVLDLACGTGNITTRLAKNGFDMIGIDASTDMLSIAMQKSADENLDIRFICQDMTDFELYGTVDAVICTLDSINYITNLKKLKKVFELVKNYLNPNGLFIFDINTEYKFSEILGNNKYIFDEGDIFYTWENEFNKKTKICKLFLTFFIKNGVKYERVDETHTQRAYSKSEISESLQEVGLTVLDCFDCLSFNEPTSESERLFFVSKYLC